MGLAGAVDVSSPTKVQGEGRGLRVREDGLCPRTAQRPQILQGFSSGVGGGQEVKPMRNRPVVWA